MIVVYIVVLIIGFGALIKGADVFVDGSSRLATAFNVPKLIIGLTIVSLGTSAPELAVSMVAAINGSNEIAISNVVGSNLFNLLVVLGACALIAPLPIDRIVMKRDFPAMLISTIVLLGALVIQMFYTGSIHDPGLYQEVATINRPVAVIFLILFSLYISLLIYVAKNNTEGEVDEDKYPIWKCIMMIVIGLALIVAGGQAVVFSAKEIARAAGMTETLIGLTIVAIGTSLPELVTSVVAARKGENGLAMGNVVGSCILNILLILGLSSLVHPIGVNTASIYDLSILFVTSILVLLFSYTRKHIVRAEGSIMLFAYAAYMIYAIMR